MPARFTPHLEPRDLRQRHAIMTTLSPILAPQPKQLLFKRQVEPLSLANWSLIGPAIWASFQKLDPRGMVKNPVMFCVEIVSVLTTIFFLRDLFLGGSNVIGAHALFSGQITLWLWFTVVFANFAEAVAEGRGQTPGDNLRQTRTETMAKRLVGTERDRFEEVSAAELHARDLVFVEPTDLVPSDGDVLERIPSLDQPPI